MSVGSLHSLRVAIIHLWKAEGANICYIFQNPTQSGSKSKLQIRLYVHLTVKASRLTDNQLLFKHHTYCVCVCVMEKELVYLGYRCILQQGCVCARVCVYIKELFLCPLRTDSQETLLCKRVNIRNNLIRIHGKRQAVRFVWQLVYNIIHTNL